VDTSYPGPGTRSCPNISLTDAANVPVGGISLRSAAIFCSWLQDNKSLDLAAFMDGAYSVSAFDQPSPWQWVDQQAHHADENRERRVDGFGTEAVETAGRCRGPSVKALPRSDWLQQVRFSIHTLMA
jgi:hypothetical protein